MPADDVRTEHSAGGIVFRVSGDQVDVLMIRDRYGHWGFPKGHLEEGEDSRKAALREIAEETGVTQLTPVADLGTIDWHFRLRGRHVHKFCQFFLFEALDCEPRPQVEEGIERAEWVGYDEAVEQVSYDNAREVLGRGRRAISTRLRTDERAS